MCFHPLAVMKKCTISNFKSPLFYRSCPQYFPLKFCFSIVVLLMLLFHFFLNLFIHSSIFLEVTVTSSNSNILNIFRTFTFYLRPKIWQEIGTLNLLQDNHIHSVFFGKIWTPNILPNIACALSINIKSWPLFSLFLCIWPLSSEQKKHAYIQSTPTHSFIRLSIP